MKEMTEEVRGACAHDKIFQEAERQGFEIRSDSQAQNARKRSFKLFSEETEVEKSKYSKIDNGDEPLSNQLGMLLMIDPIILIAAAKKFSCSRFDMTSRSSLRCPFYNLQ